MNSISYIAHKVDDALTPLEAGTKGPQHDTDAQEGQDQPTVDTSAQAAQEPPRSMATYVIGVLLFLPNVLIVRPLLFCWFIVTFPLSLIERSRGPDDEAKAQHGAVGTATRDDDEEEEEDDDDNLNDNDTDDIQNMKTDTDSTLPVVSNSTILELDETTDRTTSVDLKSPTSPLSSQIIGSRSRHLAFPKTVFPQALVNSNARKTLVLDLDETLVHSLSRGARMSNGHMIEIKLNDHVATLYSVHKRPYCDHFLKQVSKWFNLVIFTASVKEYADPVIDWLESERKYFTHRFYRNHCTLREGQGYIKDLTSVDKNLNHVIIVDNSPISYAWHESNAVTVEGWINDATDTDLLNLIPLLRAMRYTTDVRTVLALKNGEVAFENSD